MARALSLASLPAAWIVPDERGMPHGASLPDVLAAEAAPMGLRPQSPPARAT